MLRGMASYYWQPQRVAAGGWFNPNALTAAHKSLPFGTRVRVTNMRNGRSVVVRINDRGPYIRGRIIDLSRRAATVVGMRRAGVVPVRVTVL
ncbi:MAG: septal ring lytic transglycosylase RlpA family protein [Hyphomicrobiaceae bacterium]